MSYHKMLHKTLPIFFCSTTLCPASVFPLNSWRAGLVHGPSPESLTSPHPSVPSKRLRSHWTPVIGFPTPVWSDVKTSAQWLENSCSWMCLLTFWSRWVIPQTQSQVLACSWPHITPVFVIIACQMNEWVNKWTNSRASPTPSEEKPLAFNAVFRL